MGTILLVPKIYTRLFSFKKSTLLTSFIEESKRNHLIDGRKFWMLREYYSPGSFTFKKVGFQIKDIKPTLEKLTVTIKPHTSVFPFLIFQSDKFNSIEALATTNKLHTIVSLPEKNKDCIIEQPSTYMCYTDSHTLMIIFIKPMSEMMITNGFYDYKTDEVKKITKDKYWLVISKVEM